MEDLQHVIRTRVEKWKTQLLDMGMRNRLLNYRETKRSSLKIDIPEFEALYQRLLNLDSEEYFTFRCPKDIREVDLFGVCQEFCVNFFRNLYHTSTLIRSYDHL